MYVKEYALSRISKYKTDRPLIPSRGYKFSHPEIIRCSCLASWFSRSAKCDSNFSEAPQLNCPSWSCIVLTLTKFGLARSLFTTIVRLLPRTSSIDVRYSSKRNFTVPCQLFQEAPIPSQRDTQGNRALIRSKDQHKLYKMYRNKVPGPYRRAELKNQSSFWISHDLPIQAHIRT